MRRMALYVLALALAAAAPAEAGRLGACVWGKLRPADRDRVLAAYRQDMSQGGAALEKIDARLRTASAACAGRRDLPPLWAQTLAGSEAVQVWASEALRPAGVDRARLEAAWTAAPETVKACIKANGRLAFYSNGLGCSDPAPAAWLARKVGIDPARQAIPARQTLYYFNARAIGDWGDTLAAALK